jgi:hypothetical protein
MNPERSASRTLGALSPIRLGLFVGPGGSPPDAEKRALRASFHHEKYSIYTKLCTLPQEAFAATVATQNQHHNEEFFQQYQREFSELLHRRKIAEKSIRTTIYLIISIFLTVYVSLYFGAIHLWGKTLFLEWLPLIITAFIPIKYLIQAVSTGTWNFSVQLSRIKKSIIQKRYAKYHCDEDRERIVIEKIKYYKGMIDL